MGRPGARRDAARARVSFEHVAVMAERPSWIEIDLGAIERNYQELQRLSGPDRRVIASIKANAYGHDAQAVARSLERRGVFAFWTGHVPEALALRAAGIRSKIILFGGYLPDAIPELLSHDLIPTVYDGAGIAAAAKAGRGPAPIYVKVDAGLGRLGVPVNEARSLIQNIARTPTLRLEGVYTHLPFKDRKGRDWAAASAERFGKLLEELRADGIVPEVTQLWGSSGLLCGLEDPTNAVCIGHLLYGLIPVDADIAHPADLQPACAAIKSRLIHVAHRMPGEDLAIGNRYRISNASTIGVIPLGMGDGMRVLTGRTAPEVLVRGARAPIIGVSLEHTVLDLSEIPTPPIGEEVTLVGASRDARIGLESCAAQFGCSPLELIIGFSGRLACRTSNSADDIWQRFGARAVAAGT